MRREQLVGAGFWLLVAAAFMALLVGRASAATGDEAWGRYRGQVVFSDTIIAPTAAFPSEQVMVASLKRMERNTIHGRDGFWRLHAVAFLSPTPGTGSLRLRATDVTEPGQPREVKVFELASAEPGQRELPLADLVLTDAMGFKSNHRYEIAVEGASLIASGVADAAASTGKADVYAKGVITLR